jgi:hypothetical protein
MYNWATSWQNQHNGFGPSMDPDQPAQFDQDPCCSLTNQITRLETDSEKHGSWSDCADVQAGLDQCWSQTHYVGFVVTWLICLINVTSFWKTLCLLTLTADWQERQTLSSNVFQCSSISCPFYQGIVTYLIVFL